MLTKLIDTCLRHRGIVLLATLLLILTGVASLRRLAFDAFPDTTPVQVQVNATAPALAPVEIERQVTFPLEQAISGLPGLTELRSISKFGLSQVTVIFDDDTDIYLARQFVGERIAAVRLPPGIEGPSLGPVSTGLGEVFQYVLRSETLSPRELRTLHHWVVRPQMLQVPGVAEINTWGGEEKQYHVVVDPARLVEYSLTLDDIARAMRGANRNAAGGVLDQSGASLIVQGQGLVTGIEDLASIVLASVDGIPVRLGDLADIREGSEIRRGAVTHGGDDEAVLGLGFMLMGENSRELTRRLETRLRDVERSLPAAAELKVVYRRTELVDRVLTTVRDNLLEGALLVIAVLFVSLGNLRAGLIVALAIPLSVLFAFSAMLQFGIAGSLMSLGAIDFGLVVDSSVIMVENASARLGDDRSERTVREIVRDAAIEVRKPTLLGELIIIVVYLPVLALEGIEGKLFRPMAATMIFALAGSMLASLTLMPVLASLVLKRGGEGRNALVRGLEGLYRPVLAAALRWRRSVLALAGATVVAAGLLASQLGSEFVPRLREQSLVINTVRMAGIGLDESVRYGLQIERRLLAQFPSEIADIWTRTGTAEVATDPMGLEVSDVFVTLTPRDTWRRAQTQDELVAQFEASLDGMPGMRSIFTQPIEMRMNEMIAGIRADVGVEIFGDDFDALRRAAEEVRQVVEETSGAADVTVEQLTGQGVLSIAVDRAAAGRHGVEVHEILGIIDALGRRKLGHVFEGQRYFDLVLRVDDDARSSVERIRDMPIRGKNGAVLPLSAVTRIDIIEGPSTIRREWAQRRVVVQTNVRDRDLGSFVADLRTRLRERVELPEGYHLSLGGQFEHLEAARQRLMVVVPITLLLLFGLLYLSYERAVDALRVFVGVPFGTVGGIVALWLRDMPFSISAAIGFIALSGVAVLGDMVLVSSVRRLMDQGRETLTAVREAARQRLRPVLMTASVATFGFLPMAFNTGVGAEIQRPLATVVIGGMVTSTVATLLVLPVLYVAFTRSRARRR